MHCRLLLFCPLIDSPQCLQGHIRAQKARTLDIPVFPVQKGHGCAITVTHIWNPLNYLIKEIADRSTYICWSKGTGKVCDSVCLANYRICHLSLRSCYHCFHLAVLYPIHCKPRGRSLSNERHFRLQSHSIQSRGYRQNWRWLQKYVESILNKYFLK